jgi:NAD(P)-dependent dehydrogenase (short-subunit alcohol dehydrogenase family)
MRKVVIITGAGTGFGRFSAEFLARKGYNVFATMRESAGRNAAPGEALRSLAKREELALSVLDMDVTKEHSVQAAVQAVLGNAGRIDVVLNNAGLANLGVTEAFAAEQFQKVFDTNFFGAVRVNRAVLPAMRRQRSGLLIHVSSPAARVPMAFTAAYCASKCALETLADVYRFELSPFGVDSIVLEPGFGGTSILEKIMRPDDRTRILEYGATAELTRRVESIFEAAMVLPDAVSPLDLASAVWRLIETPRGQRPFRNLIGIRTQFLVEYNRMAEELRQASAQRLGIGELLTRRPAGASPPSDSALGPPAARPFDLVSGLDAAHDLERVESTD